MSEAMTTTLQPGPEPASQPFGRPGRTIGLLGLLLGVFALGTLLLPGKLAFFVLGLLIALQWPVEGVVSVGLFVGLRFLAAGWSILMGAPDVSQPSAPEAAGLHPDSRLGLAPHPYIASLREELANEEIIRSRSDRN